MYYIQYKIIIDMLKFTIMINIKLRDYTWGIFSRQNLSL